MKYIEVCRINNIINMWNKNVDDYKNMYKFAEKQGDMGVMGVLRGQIIATRSNVESLKKLLI